jgi:hypothetical protein
MLDRMCGPFSVDSIALDRGAELPSEPGIYIWRRILAYDPVAHYERAAAETWLRSQAEAPLAVFPELQVGTASLKGSVSVRPSFVLLKEMRIGSACLEGRILLPATLTEHAPTMELLAGLVQHFGPALYVGESGNLRSRILDHVNGATGFAERLEDAGLSLRDVALWYLVLDDPPFSEAARKHIEGVLTHLVGAPLTRKAGA